MNRISRRVLACLLAMISLPTTAAVYLDPGFGDAGTVHTNISSYNGDSQFVRDVLLQDDGKIVIAGNSNDNFALIRYNTDGTTDLGFGIRGEVVTDVIGSDPDDLYSLVQQSDGKIIVMGLGFDATNDIILVRYNNDGTKDTSFGTDGQVITDSGVYEVPLAMIRQADDMLVVAGRVGTNFSLTRYTADGILDSGFGNGGFAIINTGSFSQARAVVQQADGKLIASGLNMIARFNVNGSLDTSFDTDGINTIPATGPTSLAMALQANEQIVVTGSNSDSVIAVTRFNANGSLDTDFGTGGVLTTAVGDSDQAVDIIVDNADKLVVTGQSTSAGEIRIVVLRYTTNGDLDPTFSGDGIAVTNLSSGRDYGQAIVQQADNKYVVAGQTSNDTNSDFVTLRYDTGGSLDTDLITGFNTDGYKVDWIGHKTVDVGTALLAQQDGKVLAGGWAAYAESSDVNDPTDFAITRYLADGSLDGGFANDGRIITSISSPYSDVRDMVLQADGALVTLVGSTSSNVLTRHNSDGSIDMGFGTNGVAPVASSSWALIEQFDGKLVVVSASSELRRYSALGVPDAGFGTAGLVTTSIGGAGPYPIVEQAAGKLVILGRLGLERYTDTGLLDMDFGVDGQILFPEFVRTPNLIQQSDGKLIIAYFPKSPSVSTANPVLTIKRFSAEGVLDASFGNAGTVTTVVDDEFGEEDVHAVAFQDDGKLVVFVRRDSKYLMLLRYQANGQLDTSFDDDGIFDLPLTLTNFGGTFHVGDMVIQSGSIFVLAANNSDFVLSKVIDESGATPVAHSVTASDVTQANFGGSDYVFHIVYSDADGDLDLSSIDTNDISVCNGDVCGVVSGTPSIGDSSSVDVNYHVTPPGGSWDEADNGTYTISILANEVADSELNYVTADANAGSFTVSIVDPTLPEAPIMVSGMPANNGALIDFLPPANDDGASILDYKAFCSGVDLVPIVGASSPLLVTGLNNGTTYNCFVTARNAIGEGAASAAALVTPTDNGDVTLPPSDGGPGEVVTFTHTATSPNGGTPVSATLEVVATDPLPPAPPPAEADSLVAAIDISSTGSVAGYQMVITFEIDPGSMNVFTGFWKYGKEAPGDTSHWYNYGFKDEYALGTGYELSVDRKTLTVYFTDGQRGDDDLTVNASIIDPALPIIQINPLIFKSGFE